MQTDVCHEHEVVAGGTSKFMEALAKLTSLTSLTLDEVPLVATDQQELQQFSALTASSRLQELDIFSTEVDDIQPLPKHAAKHMLVGRQCPISQG